jgi:uncharacterized membrane protein HdeD (DUF308 family)
VSSVTSHLVVLGILNIPTYLLVGKLFFDDRADFFTCIRFWLTPDIISMFRGEWAEDWWGTMRLGIFAFLCGAIVYGEYHFIFEKADDAHAAIAQPAASH